MNRILAILLSTCLFLTACSELSKIGIFYSPNKVSDQVILHQRESVARFHLTTRKYQSDTIIDTKSTFETPMEHIVKGNYEASDIKQVIQYLPGPGKYSFYAQADKVFTNSTERPPQLGPKDTVEYLFEVVSIEDKFGYTEREMSEEEERYFYQRANIYKFIESKKLDTSNIKEVSKGIFVIPTGVISKDCPKVGEEIQPNTMISVHYNGFLLDGLIFDSSYKRNAPYEFIVGEGQVIPAWDKGIPGLEYGKKYFLACTSDNAYGKYGTGGQIGPNEVLVFQIEVVN